MFILLGYYFYTDDIIYSILIGTYIYIYLFDYEHIIGLYILDIIICILVNNKINKNNQNKSKSNIMHKIKRFKLKPLNISLNYTLLHTYNNIYS